MIEQYGKVYLRGSGSLRYKELIYGVEDSPISLDRIIVISRKVDLIKDKNFSPAYRFELEFRYKFYSMHSTQSDPFTVQRCKQHGTTILGGHLDK